jgi:serine/threonine-protein kinase HipA
MLEKLYVYTFIASDGWVPCGLLEFEERGRFSSSRFRYGRRYLEREDRFAIDPIQLPLTESTLEVPGDFAVFNGIRDAGPDKWGRYLLEKRFGGRALSEIEYIAATAPDRVSRRGKRASISPSA